MAMTKAEAKPGTKAVYSRQPLSTDKEGKPTDFTVEFVDPEAAGKSGNPPGTGVRVWAKYLKGPGADGNIGTVDLNHCMPEAAPETDEPADAPKG